MPQNRTILPRKGLIQPGTGTGLYVGDTDANMALLDANVVFLSDLQQGDLGLNGVISGFTLGLGAGLVPTTTAGVLYAQGSRYAPGGAPTLPPAPNNATNYLYYNSSTGFYYSASAVGTTAGDALIGKVVTAAGAVTGVTQSTKLFGSVAVSSAASGNLSVPHLLGRTPKLVSLLITSAGLYWWQSPPYDGTNLYLVASDASALTAQVIVA